VNNPALNTHPAYRNPAFIPFGVNFIDDDLRTCLAQRNVDVDEVEKIYYHQLQDDAEFNNSRLPSSYESPLWGYIYGQRLVAAKYQLDTLRDDEQFLANYLKQTVDELTMRMNRFYPSFDYKSQIEALKLRESRVEQADYVAAYNQALADIISQKPREFVHKVFANNAFIPAQMESDADDKYGDYLPQQVESDLIEHYRFEWDFNSNLTANFQSYFERMSRMERVLAPKIDSLSKHLRKNLADFLLHSFYANNLQDVEYVVNVIEAATNSVVDTEAAKLDSLNNTDLVKNALNLLDETSHSAAIISKLFYGGNNVEDTLQDKSKEQLVSILSAVDTQRLILINKSLQIYEYLKYNSMTRLLLTCLVTEFREYFAQFLRENGDENISKFEEANNDILDEIISFQSIYYENQEDVRNSFQALMKSIEAEIGSFDLDMSQFEKPPCFVAAMLESGLNAARESGNMLDEIKYLTHYNYVTRCSSNISGLKLALFLMAPSKHGVDGSLCKNMAYQFATDSSGANDVLFTQIMAHLKNNALITNDELHSYRSDLMSKVQTELDNLRNVCVESNNSRNNLEAAIQQITLNFDALNFDHAKKNYDVLSTHLTQSRYFARS